VHELLHNSVVTALALAAATSFTTLMIAHFVALTLRVTATVLDAVGAGVPSRRALLMTFLKGGVTAGITVLFGREVALYGQDTAKQPEAVRKQAAAMQKWFKDHPEARRAVLATHRLSEEQVIELMLAQPEKYIEVVRTLVEKVKKERAPAEVVEGAQGALQMMERGVKNLGRYEYARGVVVKLKGTNDPTAFAAALDEAIAKAPDDSNRRVLRAMRQKIGQGGVIVIEPDTCHFCCLIGCVICRDFNCFVCCFDACIICNVRLP
jgi:hypothetical protein